MSRTLTTTEKVLTSFGTIYVHIEQDGMGEVIGLTYSQPGKLQNSQIGKFLDELSGAFERAHT